MTRTAAHQARYRIDQMTEDDTMYNLIDRIYDDFEDRTCGNCAFFSDIGSCENPDSMLNDKLTIDDFGCNAFEPKF